MTNIRIEAVGIRELERAFGKAVHRIPREIEIAINQSMISIRAGMAKQVREKLNITATRLKGGKYAKDPLIRIRKARPNSLYGWVSLSHKRRPGLGSFGAKQNKKGVTYRIARGGKKSFAPKAFMGPNPKVKAPKLHGGAFKRKGPNRLPIVKLHALSAWAAYLKNNMRPRTVKEGEASLRKKIEKRTRDRLRREGLI